MGFINVFIGSDCYIKVSKNQLSVKDGAETFPIEDINCVMIDNLRTTLSVYSINKLIENGAVIILCDEKHLPSNVILPYQGYYKRLSVLELQNGISKPRKKRLWQQIIKGKLEGQAACLRFFGKEEGAEKLNKLSMGVLSNDSENKEAEGARVYFASLFGDGFTRGESGDINASLNYTYAIVRSLIARELCARGFECAYGIFHRGPFNAFNLADDVIEPFCPICDCFAAHLLEEGGFEKRKLFNIVNLQVLSGGQAHSLSNAVKRMCESLLAYYKEERDDVMLPRLVGVTPHSYE